MIEIYPQMFSLTGGDIKKTITYNTYVEDNIAFFNKFKGCTIIVKHLKDIYKDYTIYFGKMLCFVPWTLFDGKTKDVVAHCNHTFTYTNEKYNSIVYICIHEDCVFEGNSDNILKYLYF